MADLLQIASLGGTAPIWALTQLKVVLGIIIWYSAMLMNASVAGELCKLARVTGPEFPPPLLSSPTLPASDWPVLGCMV